MSYSILGISARFDKPTSNQEFWSTLLAGGTFAYGMSDERRRLSDTLPEPRWGKNPKGMFLNDIDCFDRDVFSVSPPSVAFSDPRQRILIEAVWSAIQDSGIDITLLRGHRVGVFVTHDGWPLGQYATGIVSEPEIQEFVVPGNAPTFLANRISFVFDFQGPSILLESTCSGTFTAIHSAVKSMDAGDCDFAIVAAVSLFHKPWRDGESTATPFESNSKRMTSFMSSADGYITSEGCGALVIADTKSCKLLKRFAQPYAEIVSTTTNSGGKTASFAQPNIQQQIQLFNDLLKSGGITPSDVAYIEAHGVSSNTGDLVEGNAISEVFGQSNRDHPCFVSSIKPNLGHTHAASGIYSILKSVLAISKREIPPIAGFSPSLLNLGIIPVDGVQYLDKKVNWPTNDKSQYCIVSSYGLSNVNSGVLLKCCRTNINQPHTSLEKELSEFPVYLSATNDEQFQSYAKLLLNYIEEKNDATIPALSDALFSLASARTAYNIRWFSIVRSWEEFSDQLKEFVITCSSSPWKSTDGRVQICLVQKPDENISTNNKCFGRFQNQSVAWFHGQVADLTVFKAPQNILRLPPYPLARKQYWIPEQHQVSQCQVNKGSANNHEKISEYSHRLQASNFFLEDHQIQGQRILPGVMYLELLRKYVFDNCGFIRVSKMSWNRPLIIEIDKSETVFIEHKEKPLNVGRFKIFTKNDNQLNIHCDGNVEVVPLSPSPTIDIKNLASTFKLGIQSQNDVYSIPNHLNLHLGERLRGTSSVYLGEKAVLAHLKLPKDIDSSFGLHPSIMDPILQVAFLSLSMRYKPKCDLTIPFSLEECNIYQNTESTMWAWIRYEEGSNPGDRVETLAVDLIAENGSVSVEMRGFSFRHLNRLGQFNSDKKTVDQDPINTGKIKGSLIYQSVVQIISHELHLLPKEILLSTTFDSLGFDSILVTKLTSKLEEKFGSLPKTLLFETQSISELVQRLSNLTSNSSEKEKASAELINNGIISIDEEEDDPIAIVGMSGQYPGANNYSELWSVLTEGRDCISTIPSSRWSTNDYYDVTGRLPGFHHSKRGGFIHDIDCFDPMIFNISPREAKYIDPQERLILQHVWSAFEDAGYSKTTMIKTTASETGVYVGTMYSQYQLLASDFDHREQKERIGLASTMGSIANRVSYVFGFQGPSMVVDTQCSSSLTALNLACRDIRDREVKVAVVGGVNLTIHPAKYLELSRRKFISTDGVCKSFGDGGNGYVPSEGVGVFILKHLSDAIENGDTVYGIVAATAVNHGGTTSGYTVPNPKAQNKVICQAFEKAGVSPKDISYVEAHGTGTILGDPIEIAALSEAFSSNLDDVRCNVGSIKSNIGHCEAAAGMAGLTKILLQLKYRQLVPSIHSKVLNPNIDFNKTPFTIVQKNQYWQPSNSSNNTRIAALSSFGAGGSNTHVVVAEAPKNDINVDYQDNYWFPLSAETWGSLDRLIKRYIRDVTSQEIHETIGENQWLYGASCTLHLGRESLRKRIVFQAGSIHELVTQMIQWIDDPARHNKPQTSDNRSIEKWILGHAIDLNLLWGNKPPLRIALPTYPFEKQRFWISDAVSQQSCSPIKQRNIPYLDSISKNKTSTKVNYRIEANDKVLSDHIINGKKVLSGAMSLEMCVSTLILHIEGEKESIANIRLRKVKWLNAVECGESGVHLSVRVKACENIENTVLSYQIKVFDINIKPEKIIAQSYADVSKQPWTLGTAEEKLLGKQIESISTSSLYEGFKQHGLEFGNSFRTIKELRLYDRVSCASVTVTGNTQARMSIPVYDIDACFQSTVGVICLEQKQAIEEISSCGIPKGIDEVYFSASIVNSLTTMTQCRRSPTSESAFDLQLFDKNNIILAEIKGFESTQKIAQGTSVALAYPQWEDVSNRSSKSTKYQRYINIIGNDQKIFDQLCCEFSGTQYHFQFIQLTEALEINTHQILETTEITLRSISSSHDIATLHWCIMGEQVENHMYGFVNSLVSEIETLAYGQVIIFNENISSSFSDLNICLHNCIDHAKGGVFHIHNGVLRKKVFRQEKLATAKAMWFDDGVYILSGGTGGIGKLFVDEIYKNTEKSHIVLLGRSQLSNDLQNYLNRYQGRVHYRQVDIEDRMLLQNTLENVRNEIGNISGVIHMAGVLNDALFLEKSAKQKLKVLSPKVNGTKNLDYCTQHDKLEWFVAFGSIASLAGNHGQSDYALANGYLVGLIEKRKSLYDKGLRHGRSIVISWPMISSDGMAMTPAQLQRIKNTYGMESMDTARMFNIWSFVLQSTELHTIPLNGNIDKLMGWLNGKMTPAVFTSKSKSIENLNEVKVQNDICFAFSSVLDIPIDRISIIEPTNQLGFDSITITEISELLETMGYNVSTDLFYEKNTITEVAQILCGDRFIVGASSTSKSELEEVIVSSFARVLEIPKKAIDISSPTNKLGFDSVSIVDICDLICESGYQLTPDTFYEYNTISEVVAFLINNTDSDTQKGHTSVNTHSRSVQNETPKNQEIAVIGMSGEFPDADNVYELWENLLARKDSTIRVPEKRIALWRRNIKKLPIEKFRGGFLSDIAKFDYELFGISHDEAMYMDPQERKALEAVWLAIEDSGYLIEDLNHNKDSGNKKKIGVYIGSMYGMYQHYSAQSKRPFVSTQASIANRISYVFDFIGPSVAVDSMCSSGATALEMANKALKDGEIDIAIAGAVNIASHPSKFHSLKLNGMLSKEDSSQSFGSGSSGYLPSEGVGIFVLKTLTDAVNSEDYIHGVIVSSATCHTGQTNGYHSPNPSSEIEVIQSALNKCKLAPSKIQYLEAHSTGTMLGDQIEAKAIERSGLFKKRTAPLLLGTIKGNIGHTESFASIAAMTKVFLQFRFEHVPPVVHVNNKIFKGMTGYKVPEKIVRWPRLDNEYRYAGISSFGAGGTNNHTIVRDAIAKPIVDSNTPYIIPLSARSDNDLVTLCRSIANTFKKDSSFSKTISVKDIAFTLQHGRYHLESRIVFVVHTVEELSKKLSKYYKHPNNTQLLNTLPDTLASYTNSKKDITKIVRWCKKEITNWPLKAIKDCQRVSLPTRKLLSSTCWWSDNVTQTSPNVKSMFDIINAQSSHDIVLNNDHEAHLYQIISDTIQTVYSGKIKPTISISTPINTLDIDSIMVIRWAELWQLKYGIELSPSWVYEAKTIADLVHILLEKKLIFHEFHTELKPQSEIELSDLQQAFIFGRKINTFGRKVSSTIFVEIQLPNNLDFPLLNQSISLTIDRHPMLRCKLGASYRLETVDKKPFSICSKSYKEAEYETLKIEMSNRSFDLSVWPPFEFVVNSSTTNKLLFAIDEVFSDAFSVLIILQNIEKFYHEGESCLPQLEYTYINHLQNLDSIRNSDISNSSKNYWKKKILAQPSPPVFKHSQKNHLNEYAIHCYKHRFSTDIYENISRISKYLEVSDTAILLSIFSQCLHKFLNQKDLSLTLTQLNRPPFHNQALDVVGLFVSNKVYQSTYSSSIHKAIEETYKQLQSDSKHSMIDTLSVIRELKSQGKKEVSSPPVIFTSLLGEVFSGSESDWSIGDVHNTTPQVELDVHVHNINGTLDIRWFAHESIDVNGSIGDLFHNYIGTIEEFSKNKKTNVYRSFLMTDLQTSYASSRSRIHKNPLSSAAQIQIEFEYFNPKEFEKAWLALLHNHPLLSSTMTSLGRVVEGETSKYTFSDQKIVQCYSEKKYLLVLEQTTKNDLNKCFPLDHNKYYRQTFLHFEQKTCLILTVDFIVADGHSINTLTSELLGYYLGQQTSLSNDLRDVWKYLKLQEEQSTKAREILANTYWKEKFSALSSGTPSSLMAGELSSSVTQYSYCLTFYKDLNRTARKHNVTVDAILSYIYLFTLKASIKEDFSIVSVSWNRTRYDQYFKHSVGDFTQLQWLEAPSKLIFSIDDLRKINRTMFMDVFHTIGQSGTKVIRSYRHLSHQVVYTDIMDTPEYSYFIKYGEPIPPNIKIRSMLSNTANIALDCVCKRVSEDNLLIHWDSKISNKKKIEKTFKQFVTNIKKFCKN